MKDPVKQYQAELLELIDCQLNDRDHTNKAELIATYPNPISTIPKNMLVSLSGRWSCLRHLLDHEDQNIGDYLERIRDIYPDPKVFLTGSFFDQEKNLRELIFAHYIFSLADKVKKQKTLKDMLRFIVGPRLETGYFLLGLKELWPSEASQLEQQLWDELGLSVLDEVLMTHLDLGDLKDELAPEVRELLMNEPFAFCDESPEFRALTRLARHGIPGE